MQLRTSRNYPAVCSSPCTLGMCFQVRGVDVQRSIPLTRSYAFQGRVLRERNQMAWPWNNPKLLTRTEQYHGTIHEALTSLRLRLKKLFPASHLFDLEEQLGTWLRRGASFKVSAGDPRDLATRKVWPLGLLCLYIICASFVAVSVFFVCELNPEGGGASRSPSVLINSNHGAP